MTNYKPVKHYLFMVGAPSDDHDGLLSSKAENPDDAVSADEDDDLLNTERKNRVSKRSKLSVEEGIPLVKKRS